MQLRLSKPWIFTPRSDRVRTALSFSKVVEALSAAFSNTDVVVNCVTGSGATIKENALAIVDAANRNNKLVRIVHMSSMAVYGNQQGVLDESAPLSEDFGWYVTALAFFL